jgi:Leucine-rich repeat (LRR) protein/pimeloyl-ACP methyl ester carboxylesterase
MKPRSRKFAAIPKAVSLALAFGFFFAAALPVRAQNTYTNEQDSLALVDLYNATGGASWTHSDNWLNGPVWTWYGIGGEYETSGNDNVFRVNAISLGEDSLKGTISISLGNLENLQYLDLYNNQLSGTIPSSLGNLESLQSLDLYGNQLGGTIPSSLGNLASLDELLLGDNQLNGTIPSSLGNLTILQNLDLQGNQLSGTIPSTLGNLANLQNLDLGFNQLTGPIPIALSNLSNLLDLGLDGINLGAIPVWVGNLSKLQSISFENDSLIGDIPKWIGNLSNLQFLLLSGNYLSGAIPSSLSDLTSLQMLFLQDNQLSGSMPNWLGNLTDLYELFINNNYLCGTLPLIVSHSADGLWINVSNNRLSGLADYSQQTNVTHLNVSGNFLTPDALFANSANNGFVYSPQANQPIHINEQSGRIALLAPGSNINQVQWNYAGTPAFGLGGNFVTGYFEGTNMMLYSCDITNSFLPGLTIHCTLNAPVDPCFSVFDAFPSLVNSSGKLETTIDKVLTAGLTPVQGVVADSVSEVVMYYPYANTVTFTLPSGAGDNGELFSLDGTQHDKSSLTLSPVTGSTGLQYVAVIYRAPSGVGKASGASDEQISITCADASDATVFADTINLTLERPPVVLVHGMWSNRSVWDAGGFTNALQENGYYTYRADYSADNASTFDPKSNPLGVGAIYVAVNGAIADAHNRGLAATRVDVVAHSLGGLMARSYAQQSGYSSSINYNAGNIRRLVTLGTPHQGSPFGPLLWNNKSEVISLHGLPITLSALFAIAQMPIGTCHRDFDSASTAYADLTACSIPSHAIVGLWSPGGSADYNALASLLFLLFHVTPSSSSLFGSSADNTDLIVEESSQLDGLTNPDLFDEFSGVIHADILGAIPFIGTFVGSPTETSNKAIQDTVMSLLQSTENENHFSSLPAPQIAAPIHQGLPESMQHDEPLANGSIQITAPSSGTVVSNGDSVTITITSQGTDPLQTVMIWIPQIGVDSLSTQLPASVTVKMPTNLPIGSLSILAMARDINGGLLADTLSVSVQDTGSAYGMQVVPATLSLTPSYSISTLEVTGIFSDGDFDITQGSSGTNYATSSGGSGVIQVSANGVVTAVKSGNDSVIVTNGANRSSIPVKVDLSLPIVTSSPHTSYTNASLQAYPNPTSTSETLLYSLPDESSVSITIYDLLGRIVARPVVGEMESGGQHATTFDTQGLPNGLYWCRLAGGGIVQSAKMVIAR